MADDYGSNVPPPVNPLNDVVSQLTTTTSNLNDSIKALAGALGQLSGTGIQSSKNVVGGPTYANRYGSNAGGPSFSGSGGNSGGGGGVGWFGSNMAGGNGTAAKVGLGIGLASNAIGLGNSILTGGVTFSNYMTGSMALATAAQMNTFGSSSAANFSGMPGIAGANSPQDYAAMKLTATSLGNLAGTGNFSRWMTGAASISYVNPLMSGAQAAQAMSGFGQMSTNNMLTMFGLSSYQNGKQISPAQLTANLLSRTGMRAYRGATASGISQAVLGQNTNFSADLNAMIQSGAITATQAQAMRGFAGNILTAESKGMTSQQAVANILSGTNGNKSAQATEKTLGTGNTNLQAQRSAEANVTSNLTKNLGTFNSQITTLSNTLSKVNINLSGYNTALGLMNDKAKATSGASKVLGGVGHVVGKIGGTTIGRVGEGAVAGAAIGGMLGGPLGLAAGTILGGVGAGLFGMMTGKGGPNDLGPQDPFGNSTATPSAISTSSYDEASVVQRDSGNVGGTNAFAGYGNRNSSPSQTAVNISAGGNYGTSQGIACGKVTPAQAIATIKRMIAAGTNIGVGRCQANVHAVYGIGNGAPSAVAAWRAAKFKHPMSDPPPVGAFIFWTGGSQGYGHVAIYAGSGKVYSPGYPGDLSHWGLTSIAAINTQWGLNLVGWSEDNNGVRVIKPATATKSQMGKSATSSLSVGAAERAVRTQASKVGWGAGTDWKDIVNIVDAESNWDVHAQNPHSAAYGIPQANPGSKMATAGADWRNSASTQGKWMMSYIKEKYKNPEGAWNFHKTHGWYDKGAWKIGQDQVATIHKGEMVLPADPAERLRDLLSSPISGKNSGGSGGLYFGKDSICIHVQNGSAASGTRIANEFVHELENNVRLKKLMSGVRD